MPEHSYDVILYGASGFVGKQTVQYFASHAPADLQWAIAGRSRQKLEAVRDEIGVTVDVLVADSQNQTEIDAIVSQTRVILTTVGPFALYGTAIVDACVRFKTHYVDITGETPWVRTLIDRYHAQAAIDGTRIIPCCGFDSVPSDLGGYLIVRYLQRELNLPCQQVNAYFQAAGGFNGGTLASAFNLYDSQGLTQMNQPFLLNPVQNQTQDQIIVIVTHKCLLLILMSTPGLLPFLWLQSTLGLFGAVVPCPKAGRNLMEPILVIRNTSSLMSRWQG
jgi:short subunit dehydrogenase-like uncharacterized protein